MPSGEEDETGARDELLSLELLLFEPLLAALYERVFSGPLLLELLVFELTLFELLALVLVAPVAARAFLVDANVYPVSFQK